MAWAGAPWRVELHVVPGGSWQAATTIDLAVIVAAFSTSVAACSASRRSQLSLSIAHVSLTYAGVAVASSCVLAGAAAARVALLDLPEQRVHVACYVGSGRARQAAAGPNKHTTRENIASA